MKKKLLLQDIMDYISQSEGLTPEDADTFVRSFFDIVEQGLLEDKIVKIKGLGTFKLVAVSERESVNINTGERIQIEGHSKISFTPDSSMKELINRPFAHFEPVELNDETNAEELDKIDWNNPRKNEDSEDNTDDEDDTADSDDNADEEEDYIDNSEEELADSNATEKKHDGLNVQSEPDFSIELASAPCPPEPDDNTADSKMTETDASARSDAEEVAMSAPIELGPTSPEASQPHTSVQVHEHQNEEIPHPTIIAPPDLAESDAQRETAKVKIDSNEDEGETDEPVKDSTTKETAEPAENPEISEEEIIVTSPRPITSEHISTHTSNTMGYAYVEVPPRRRINWWKRGVLILLFALSLIASYFAGYYRLLCPCIFISNDNEGTAFTQSPDFDTPAKQSLQSVSSTPVSTEPNDTTTETSSYSQKGNPDISSAVTTEPSEAEAHLSSNKTNLQPIKVEESNPKHKATQQVQSILSSQAPSKPAVQNQSTPAAQQRPKTHRVKVGDTLYKIARKYYGSEKAVEKIIKYNHLPNADYIQLGMELQLP